MTDPAVVTPQQLDDNWTVTGLLDEIAAAEPSYHALIDTGALVTGFTNFEVAKYLLTHGLKSMEGVVFLDSEDRQMILLRTGMKVMQLNQCGLPWGKRFSFYDQVHTTGMDIKQVLNAQAICTLGKDMTFRDYAQGTFRMRGIGQGQTIRLFIVPEIQRLILTQVGAGLGISRQQVQEQLDALTPADRDSQMIKHVCAWLFINGMKSEKTQFNLLMEQSVSNVWRKASYRHLMENFAEVGTKSCTPFTNHCLDVYRERVDFDVENSIRKCFSTSL